MLQRSIMLSVSVLLIGTAGAVQAADAPAGKEKVDAVCGECHEAADWQGTSEAQLQALIKDVVAGKVKHPKKLSLSDADIANIAAYWASVSAAK